MNCKTNSKTKPNTKNDHFIVRCEGDWKDKVRTISESVGGTDIRIHSRECEQEH